MTEHVTTSPTRFGSSTNVHTRSPPRPTCKKSELFCKNPCHRRVRSSPISPRTIQRRPCHLRTIHISSGSWTQLSPRHDIGWANCHSKVKSSTPSLTCNACPKKTASCYSIFSTNCSPTSSNMPIQNKAISLHSATPERISSFPYATLRSTPVPNLRNLPLSGYCVIRKFCKRTAGQ